jgi:fumarylacetoacetase
MSLGRSAWREARATIQHLLSASTASPLRDDAAFQAKALIHKEKVTNHLQAEIGDYTDFYASKEHASNVGAMFRGKDNALMPNWWV